MLFNRTAAVDLHLLARAVNWTLPLALVLCIGAGQVLSFYFHFLTVPLFYLNLLNISYLWVQRRHTLLRNFGIVGQGRYFLESIGPELRQYLFANDREERPFNRVQRTEVYRKSRGVDSTSAFGSLREFDGTEVKLRHSMFPTSPAEVEPFELVIGGDRSDGAPVEPFTMRSPLFISGMSYGSLSAAAVEALSRGAAEAGIPMNTGEGGYPKYHLRGGADLIFQLGTAKFGVRHEDGRLDEDALRELCAQPQVRMIEIKFSQGAKPGKGGLLPKEKISPEIAALRGVPMGRDVVSPPRHAECRDLASTVAFIRRIQEVSGIVTGIKVCLGSPDEFDALLREMMSQGVLPDFITVDGAEGGTGAAPAAFLDGVGLPLYTGLVTVDHLLRRARVRDRIKLLASGKLVTPKRQVQSLCLGADACGTARGFMLAMGCIQALECNHNTCPVGITTHDPALLRGFFVPEKSRRVANYAAALNKDFVELLAALGVTRADQLGLGHVYIPESHPLAATIRHFGGEPEPVLLLDGAPDR